MPSPYSLFIFGSAHDTVPIIDFARLLGWKTTVSERSAQLATRERFRQADRHLRGPLDEAVELLQRTLRPAALVMSHHYESDRAALHALTRTHAPYIGLLGSSRRAARLLEDLAAEDDSAPQALAGRLFAPVGLPIGAEGPVQIALAIVAQIQNCFAGAEAP